MGIKEVVQGERRKGEKRGRNIRGNDGVSRKTNEGGMVR